MQLWIFVFGIIGPIFLVVFFASQPDPGVKWAYWFGLFITYADIMVALIITKGTLDNEKAASMPARWRRPSARRLTDGAWAANI
jgi:hypothetical protein